MPKIWLSSVVILLALISYTYFKIGQFLPEHKIFAVFLTFLLIVIMIGWEFLYRYNVALANATWFRVIAWIGSTILGVWVTFILFSLVVDLFRLVFWLVTTLSHTTPFSQIQNLAFSQRVSLTLLVISLIIAWLGLKTALSGPKIVEVFVPLKINQPS
jgi:hypothetical protein